uniref:NB-ARC domain-containing protein n=1 Tax=Parastrongyloides trichosuri TaxID=131310 RepID=A0A0N4ZZ87_PARTI
MLDQISQRILANAADVLCQDFDPKNSIHFFLAKGILNDDDVEEIKSCSRRDSRIQLFLTKYRKTCINLIPLKEYFINHANQQHIAEMLEENNCDETNIINNVKEPSVLLNKMNISKVPMPLNYQISRVEMEKRMEKDIKKFVSKNKINWLIINGMRGCGKTRMLGKVLRNNVNFLVNYINNIYWITDSCEIASKSRNIFIKLLISITDNSCLQTSYPEDDDLLMSMVVEEIQSKPGKTLIIIDDVLLEDNIRWYDEMLLMVADICKVISLSPNEEIFQAISQETIKFNFKANTGFNEQEIGKFFKFKNSNENLTYELIQKIISTTSGLPSFLGILRFKSSEDISKLSKIVERLEYTNSLSTFTAITPYPYKNLETVFDKDFSIMEDSDIINLCHLCLLFKPNIWYHTSYATLILPLDVPSYNCDIPSLVYESLEKLCKLSLLFIENDKFMIHPIIFKYCIGKQCSYHSIDKENLISLFLTRLNAVAVGGGDNYLSKVFKNFDKNDCKEVYNQLKEYHMNHENNYIDPFEKTPLSYFSFFKR